MGSLIDYINEEIRLQEDLEKRNVCRTSNRDYILSTVEVNDRPYDYETAVCYNDFNDDNWIVLDGYDDIEDARRGHFNYFRHFETRRDISVIVDIDENIFKRGE